MVVSYAQLKRLKVELTLQVHAHFSKACVRAKTDRNTTKTGTIAIYQTYKNLVENSGTLTAWPLIHLKKHERSVKIQLDRRHRLPNKFYNET
jgi:hypothetical protein